MAKKLETSLVKCKGCGSDLTFDPENQCLICKSCKRTQNFPKFKKVEKHLIDENQSDLQAYKDWTSQNKYIRCQTCGAEISLSNLEYSNKCPYCESTYVAEIKALPGFSPDAVIPFAFNEKEAERRFQAEIKKKFWVPRSFKRKVPENKILGMYIPSFTFDASTHSSYQGVLVKETTGSKGRTHVRRFSIAGEKSLRIDSITIETSSKLNQNQIDSLLPYNKAEMYKFDERFIKGYVVEHYDQSLTDSHKIARKKMREIIKHNILKNYSYTYVASLHINTIFSEELFTYRLNPVYKFEYQYKGEPYNTFMNGQTGKIGKGLPVSMLKITFVVLAIILLIIGIVLLFVLL